MDLERSVVVLVDPFGPQSLRITRMLEPQYAVLPFCSARIAYNAYFNMIAGGFFPDLVIADPMLEKREGEGDFLATSELFEKIAASAHPCETLALSGGMSTDSLLACVLRGSVSDFENRIQERERLNLVVERLVKIAQKKREARLSMRPWQPAADEVRHVFISYKSSDFKVMQGLRRVLERVGLTSFYLDSTERQPDGDSIRARILEYMERSRAFVVLLTPEAVESGWVRYEIQKARRRLGSYLVLPALLGVDADRVPVELAGLPTVDLSGRRLTDQVAWMTMALEDYLQPGASNGHGGG
jgi:hypothetical protein